LIFKVSVDLIKFIQFTLF